MTRTLVIGGTGYLGGLLVPALVRAGHEITVLSADQKTASAPARYVTGLRHDKKLLRELVEETRFDGIVDLIAYHQSDVADLVDICRHTPHRMRRYVLLSTLAVIRGFRTPLATEESAVLIEGPDTDYGSGKAACERTVLAAAWQGFPGVILRSAPIFGPGDAVSRENYVVQRLLLGLPIPCLSATNASVVRIFARDLVQAIVSCLMRPLPAGRAYHLVQRENVTFERYVRSVATMIGCTARLEPIDWERVEQAGLNPAALPLGVVDPTIRFSVDRAAAELGFRPTPFLAALQETIECVQKRGAFEHSAWPGRGSTQSRLAGTQQHLQLEAERGLWSAERSAALDDDEIIRSLVEPGGCAMVCFEHWPAIARLEASTQEKHAVLLPESLLSWLPADPEPIRSDRRPVFQAAIEPIRHAADTEYHLYSRELLRRANTYAFSNAPVTLRLCQFRDFVSLRPASPVERIVLAVRDQVDADALIGWLQHSEREQAVLVSDVPAFARIYLVDSIGWTTLSGGAGWQAALRASLARTNPHIGQWCGVFEACRLLEKQSAPVPTLGWRRFERETMPSSK